MATLLGPRDRSVVRRINDLTWQNLGPGGRTEPVPFLCECGALDCEEFVPLTLREYDRARSDGIWFTAAIHAVPDAKLVRAAPAYCVFGLW